MLQAVAEAYRTRRHELEQQADTLVDAIKQASERPPSGEPLTGSLLSGVVPALRRSFDPQDGGFGPAPKFPSRLDDRAPPARATRAAGDEDALDMARLTLDRMAAGGMYDLLGGGFHRYSVDAHWLVPHFEKMLYDNALLASAYLHAWVVTGEERYRRVCVRDTRLRPAGAASSRRRPRLGAGRGHARASRVSPSRGRQRRSRPFSASRTRSGSSPSSTDARSSGREVPEEARDGAPGRPRAEAAASPGRQGTRVVERSDARRAGRGGGPARAGGLLAAAVEVAEFLLGPLSDERGRLLRSYRAGDARIPAYLEDYANVANGLVELSWATGELRWLEEARRLAGLIVELFGDPVRGGFYVDAPPETASWRAARSSTTIRHPPGTRWRRSSCSGSRESTATPSSRSRPSVSSGSRTR